MDFKAAIFDLDGTMIDSLQDLYLTMSRVLEAGGYPGIDLETVRHLIGNGAREFVRLSLPPHARDEQNVDKFLKIYRQLYDERGWQNTVLYDGIEEVLDALFERGVKVCILSNKPHPNTLDMVEKLFPKYKFDYILGQKDIFPPKPDPSSALHVAEVLGISASEIALIGDGDSDVMTAINGGFFPISVLWGYRTKEELEEAGANVFADSPRDILKIMRIE
jgi:phosphoglycolate phosphatase